MTTITYQCDDEAIYVGEGARVPAVVSTVPPEEELSRLSRRVHEEMDRVSYSHLFSPGVLRHIATVGSNGSDED